MKRARVANAQALSRLRHIEPLLATPLLAQVGD
jgi:hypothetical protein